MHLTVGSKGRIYVAEYANDRIQVFDSHGAFIALIGKGNKKEKSFDAPGGVAVDQEGRIFVADFYNHHIQVLSADGLTLMQIGKKGRFFGGNFDYPTDVAIGPKGFLYFAPKDLQTVVFLHVILFIKMMGFL